MIKTSNFTIYNASAGSGKTYTLVKEYLTLLLSNSRNDAYKNILAITFTNKAVAEMKSRVITSLSAIAAPTCPGSSLSLLNDLVEGTNLSKEQIQKKAGDILQDILHNYAAFDISTIDRFTHKILRTFARDLGIPVNFEVELNTLLVLQEAVDRLIANAGEDEMLTRILVNYTLSKADDDKSWDISKDLFQFSLILIKENHQKYVRSLRGKSLEDFKNFSTKLKKEIKAAEGEITHSAMSFFTLVDTESLERLDFKSGYIYDYFRKLNNSNYEIIFGAKWQENIDSEKLYAAKVPQIKKDILDSNQEKIALLFKISRAAIFKREYLKEVNKNLTPLSLLSEIANEIEKIKKERSLVLISDFNPTIAAEVNNQPVPFIYERLGERYKNYFIDEFQDTSEMQWQNIIPLIDHALSSEQPENDRTGLTLVGDAKQSIYRFRGGKAEQFISLCTDHHPFNVERNLIPLPNNYRSSREIVEFNNSFFKYVSNHFNNTLYRDLFAGSSQEPKKDGDGFVNISFLETENSEDEKEKSSEKVYEIIRELEKIGTSKSDICVLTRTRKESAIIANFLSDKGISIVSSESLLVANSPEVEFIDTLLEFSLHPTDKSLKWILLNFLFDKLEIKDQFTVLVNNLQQDHNSFFHWLKIYDIYFDLQQIQALSLYEAAEYIIRSFRLIKEPDAYLQFYLDYIFEKTQKSSLGITDFLQLWEQDKDKLSIIAPKSEDAVQLMTIHKSKGLEFPVVIYPFANSSLRDVSRENIWLPLPEDMDDIPYSYFKVNKKMCNWGELEASAYQELVDQTKFDSINILYVALTRAAKKLFVLSCYDLKDGNEKDDKVSGLLIGYLKSINQWNEKLSYDFGENTSIESEKKSSGTAKRLENFYSSPTSNQAVNIVTRSGALWGSLQEEAIQKGNLVHDVLSEIDTGQDLPAALEKYTSEEEISSEERKELENLILNVIGHPELSQFFSTREGVYRERNIICPTGEILRPDRLIFKGKEVSIIDYKTGNPQNSHRLQIEQYAGVLNEMGFTVNNKLLVYINNNGNISIVK